MSNQKNYQRGIAPIAIVIIALIILGGGYVLLQSRGPAGPASAPEDNQVVTTTLPEPAPVEPTATPILSITMKQVAKSGQHGTTTISSLSNGKTKVEIALDGEPADAAEPAHIHVKSCKDKGEVKYALTDVVGGLSETILDASAEEVLKDAPLSINVHQSADKLNVFMACGDIGPAEKKMGMEMLDSMESAMANPRSEMRLVHYTAAGFVPPSVDIQNGESVTFVNESDQPMWVASTPHPTHSDLAGFDQKVPVGKGGRYGFSFTKGGSFGFHNHLKPADVGTVVVK